MKEAKGITTYQRIERLLAAGHLMSNMFFPDDASLCRANEVIFRTNFANWWSGEVAKLGKEELQRRIRSAVDSGLNVRIPSAAEDPCAWVRRRIFDDYLGCYGGAIEAALALKDSPSEKSLEREWMQRWFGVVYTGRLTVLIGSINQHTSVGASLNKAICQRRSKSTSTGRSKNASVWAGFEFRQGESEGDFPPRQCMKCLGRPSSESSSYPSSDGG